MLMWYWAAVPSEIAGLPTWALNGLSVGSLVMFILAGLATSRLWTKSQVEIIRTDHTGAITQLNKQHDREVEDLKARYEKHIERTVELWQGRTNDALTRESEWREVALRWQAVSELLSSGIEPMQEQSAATLEIMRAWQAARTKGFES